MTDETMTTATTEAPETQARTGPVTLSEVREIAPDPFQTSAGKVRAALGRGSQATIQKHLEQLRAERRREQAITEADTPPAPDDVLISLWSTAWTAAAAQVRTRLEAVTAERDGYKAEAQALAVDVAETAEALDAAEALAVKQARDREQEQQAAAAVLAAVEQQAAAALEQAQAEAQAKAQAAAEELEQAKTQAADQARADAGRIRELEHAAQIAEREREIEKQALRAEYRAEVDRLTNQLGEVKALLWQREPATTAWPATPPKNKTKTEVLD